jgi:nucleoside-diphosphate-sugar epimerase
MTQQRVLVTGGSGFIAGHCILQLLDRGFRVRTTVRSLDREESVRAILADAGMTRGDALEFVAADLLDDAGWDDAVVGVDFVLHVASPVAPGHVENEDALIVPAREGTLRVLRAARNGSVKRVVLTSAFHAVSWGHPHDGHVFTEDDWTILDGPGVDAYGKSKTLAERAAWDFIASEGGPMELVTTLPVAVMGPIMGTDISGSNHIIQTMLTGGFAAFPDLYIPVVDVRDVAIAHVLAMTADGAAGQRFLLSSDPVMSLAEIGAILKSDLGAAAARVPTRTIPSLVVRVGGLFNARMRAAAADVGYRKQLSSEKARRVLGWEPRPSRDAVAAAGESMLTKGLVAQPTQ